MWALRELDPVLVQQHEWGLLQWQWLKLPLESVRAGIVQLTLDSRRLFVPVLTKYAFL